MYNKNVILILIYWLFLLSFFFLLRSVRATNPNTCPQDGGWTKIDSDDLSTYPVDGATSYCFKYGSSNSRGCEGGLSDVWPPNTDEKYCGLSHWSYYISEVTPTPTPTPEVTPTETPTPTVDPSPTPTEKPEYEPSVTPTTAPSATPTQEPTPAPTDDPGEILGIQDQWETVVNNPEIYPAGIK